MPVPASETPTLQALRAAAAKLLEGCLVDLHYAVVYDDLNADKASDQYFKLSDLIRRPNVEKVELEIRHASNPSPVSPWRGEPWRRIAGAVVSTLGGDIVPTPYVQLGASSKPLGSKRQMSG